MKRVIVLLVLTSTLLSCGTKRNIITKKNKIPPKTERIVINAKTEEPKVRTKKEDVPETAPLNAVERYVLKYNGIAMDEMRTSKIPASITLAQGILESGSGEGRLSVKANNHFGIKCHGWSGKKIYHDDDRSQECFRKYDYAHSSFRDHSEFLMGRARYAKLFDLRPDDYRGWAKGLRAAGYATDRKYPDKLISLIKRYNLDTYDAIVLGSEPRQKNNVLNHRVQHGDTLYSLSRKYNMTVDELKQLNGLKSNTISLGQFLIIKSN